MGRLFDYSLKVNTFECIYHSLNLIDLKMLSPNCTTSVKQVSLARNACKYRSEFDCFLGNVSYQGNGAITQCATGLNSRQYYCVLIACL